MLAEVWIAEDNSKWTKVVLRAESWLERLRMALYVLRNGFIGQVRTDYIAGLVLIGDGWATPTARTQEADE